MTNDIFVHIIDFDSTTTKEVVTCNADGSYSIFINARISQEQQNNAYIHALKHILRLDFESSSSADVIEAYTHRLKAI